MRIIVFLSSYIAFLSRISAAAPNDINPDCFDQDSLCSFWAVTGECDRGILWMTFTCPFSCGFCAADGIQGDVAINPQDGDLASGNFCDNSDFPLNLIAKNFQRFAGMPSHRIKKHQVCKHIN